MKPFRKQIVALDIQDRYVKCVQIKYSSHSWKVQKSSLKEIEENGDPLSYHTQAAYTIKSLLQEMDLYPPRRLVTSISGRDAAVKLLRLPPLRVRGVKVEEMIKYELTLNLPVNVDQMGYDYQIIEESHTQTRVLTAAAKKNILNRHLRLLMAAGIYPDIVTTSSLNLFNVFAEKAPESIRNGFVGLVGLKDSYGDVVICEDGCLIYARSFTFQSGEQLIRELHNSFENYASKTEDSDSLSHVHTISRIYLLTDDGNLPDGLTEADLNKISYGSQWEVQAIGDNLVFGIALAGASSDKILPRASRLNLIKQIALENLIARREARKARLMKLSPAIVAGFLLIISGILWWQVHQAEGKLHSLENSRQVAKQRVDNISKLQETEKSLQNQIMSLGWLTKGYPMVSYRLYQINRSIPSNVWLKEVYIPESVKPQKEKTISEIYVTGYAYEQNHIKEFMAGLRQCDCFSSVDQVKTSEVSLVGEKVLEFTICLKSAPAHSES